MLPACIFIGSNVSNPCGAEAGISGKLSHYCGCWCPSVFGLWVLLSSLEVNFNSLRRFRLDDSVMQIFVLPFRRKISTTRVKVCPQSMMSELRQNIMQPSLMIHSICNAPFCPSHGHSIPIRHRNFGARGRYLGHGIVITYYSILYDMINYICLRYMLLVPTPLCHSDQNDGQYYQHIFTLAIINWFLAISMLRPCLTPFPVLIGLYHPHMIGDNNTRNQTFWCSFLHFLFHSVLW